MSEVSFGPEGAIEFTQAPLATPDRALQPAEPISPDAPRPLPEVAAWLRESPNNPDYEHSDLYQRLDDWLARHEHAIVARLEPAIADLDFKHEADDLRRLAELRSKDRQPQGMFSAYDIAYPEVAKTIVNEFQETTTRDGRETINNRAVSAIGATMLRAEYMRLLAERNASTIENKPPFQVLFRQNILAIIQHAAWLESHAEPSSETPDLHIAA